MMVPTPLSAHISTNRLLAIWRACVICRVFFSGDLAIASRHLGMVLAGRFDLCSDLLPVSACGLEHPSTDQIPGAVIEICGDEPVFAYIYTNGGLSLLLIRNIHFDHQTGLEIPCVRIVDDLDVLQLGKINIWAGVETKDEAAHTVLSGGAKRDAKKGHSRACGLP